jgi:hypothetical protein
MAEVQTGVDRDQRFSWPLSVELGRSRYGCEGALVVLTTSPEVRRWIERDIVPATGLCGATRQLRPCVIALDEIDSALLLRPDRPHLVRLAVAARAEAPDLPRVAAQAVRITVEALPEHLATRQLDAILGMVDRALRVTLERELMENPRFISETFQRWHAEATAEGLAKGLAKGRAKGRAEGRAEGRAQALAEIQEEALAKGKAEGLAKSILTVLAARGLPVSDALRARILRCTDLDMLDAWLRRAAVASSASAVVRAPARANGVAGRRQAAGKPGAVRKGSSSRKT